ncbi:hypothetical protein D3C79_950250 [compost metagenome]
MVSHDADTVGISTNQAQKTLTNLIGRMPIEGQRHYGIGWNPSNTQQVSDTVNDYASFARSWPSQHQAINVVVIGNDESLLSAQDFNNGTPGCFTGGVLEYLLAAGKVAL